MPLERLNVALLGCGFMGRVHSAAWADVRKYFKLPIKPVLHTVAGMPDENVQDFADRWGWEHASMDWKAVVANPEIDLVDIVSPNNMHAPMAIEAMKAGKYVACEKPIAGTLDDAQNMRMMALSRDAKTFVWFCYRHAPAVALAYQLVRENKIGRIFHANFFYLQDWADPTVPLVWRFKKESAGSGAHGDLNAHIVDMCQFLTGENINVKAAMAKTIIKQRKKLVGNVAGGIAEGLSASEEMGEVTVDDALAFLAELSGGGMAIFQAARQATGNQNRNGFEICGERGSLRFDFERMNELWFYDATAPRNVQGWTNIMVTHGADHPYVGAYWPDAHPIGYQHCFINEAFSIIRILNGEQPVVPVPDFADAAGTQCVLHNVLTAAQH